MRSDLGRRQRMGIVAAEQVDVLAHAQHLRHAGHLQHGADARPRVSIAGIAPQHPRAARVGRYQPQQQAHSGCFPGAVRAQQGDHFPGAQLQREVVERGDRPVALGHGMQFAPRSWSAKAAQATLPGRLR